MRAAPLLLALALAGCAQAPAGLAKPPTASASSGGPAASQWEFHLPDLPAGQGWAILELEPLGAQDLSFSYRDSYPLGPALPRCGIVQVEGAGFSFLGTAGRARLVVSPVQREPAVDQSTAPTGFFDTTFSYRLPASGAVQVLVAYGHAREWMDAGATLDLNVSSTGAFRHRVAASGTLDCLTALDGFPEGDVVESPAGTWARDLRAPFALRGSGFGWVLVSSDLGYSYRLAGPGGVVVQDEGAPGESGEGFQLKGVPAGGYALEVTSLAGRAEATAAFVVADLPTASALRFSRPPPA